MCLSISKLTKSRLEIYISITDTTRRLKDDYDYDYTAREIDIAKNFDVK